jgi:hypothetical protein
MGRCASALLVTGRAVVIGTDVRAVNSLVEALAFFVPLEDRGLVQLAGAADERAAAPDTGAGTGAATGLASISPDLKLQGVIAALPEQVCVLCACVRVWSGARPLAQALSARRRSRRLWHAWRSSACGALTRWLWCCSTVTRSSTESR